MKRRIAVLLAGCLIAGLGAVGARAGAESGLHQQDWFHASFGLLAEDLADAAAAGKRLAVVWEQKGCPACAQMHEIHFRDPAIVEFVKRNFVVVQLDYRGDRPITDFDGQVLAEKELARKYAIATTPVVQFFPATPDAFKGKKGAAAEVARMPGLLKPDMFLALFQYVRGRHYEKEDFASYLRSRKKPES